MSTQDYKIIKGKHYNQEINIAYPKEMDDEIIQVLEKCRKNKTFINLILGDVNTGETWNEINDTKGVIGLSKGREYYFPLLVSFGEEYDFLNEKSFQYIGEYLNEENLEINDVLSDGGSSLSNYIVAIRENLNDNDVIYKHPNFQSKHDFENFKIVEETLNTLVVETSSLGGETKSTKERKCFTLLDENNQVYSRHTNKKDAEEFLETHFENNLIDIKRMKEQDNDLSM